VRKVLDVGQKAKQMLGRTPESIETIRPLRDGVIADFIATEGMLRQFIKRTKTMFDFRHPCILICVPSGATPVERRGDYETAISAGARRRAYLIEESVAAAIGAGLPVDETTGSMVLDIVGGTADIAVLSLGGVVQARSLLCAVKAIHEAIIRDVRLRYHLLIGETNAERIKIEAGTASHLVNGRLAEIHIRGRDLRQGKPKSIVLGPKDIAEALEDPVEELAGFVQRTLEDLPPRYRPISASAAFISPEVVPC
jgi:rod shape-determining protein MreB